MLRWELRGTHLAALRGLAPTGRAIDFPGMVLMRFVDGKVCDAKVVWHALGMQQQLGLLDTAANTQAGASR
jgi:predicted ester cyclase